ncbi:hypothetical protein VB713_12400 [Anabaena cylindrica UHCC 0172]|uniref:hypothetical protein n=1 Tax=Anabaena cylindrica TaxID=1165 RepID=UPI002B20D7E1|nr:hypothetical protein [Anabaena cylindrica]MEA5551773.1 hypothetical protein [Anabaena cylindrica UHCC 0172]
MKEKFHDYLKSGSANNTTVAVLALAGLLCGAKSFTGTQVNMIEYCFRPEVVSSANRGRYCTPSKIYVMPESDFNAEAYSPTNPDYQRAENFLPSKATRLRTIPPSNPDKPAWGIAATLLMTSAYGLSKARENRLVQLLPMHREQVKIGWLIAKLQAGLRMHKEAYSAQLDYEFHQWSEDRRVRSAQLAAMTPQELAVYQQQVRLKAEAEAQRQTQQLTGQPVAQLPGQSLDDITRSGDKVTGDSQGMSTFGLPTSGNASSPPGDDLAIGQRIVDELVSSKLSTLLAAPSGAGKSVTQAYWLTKLFQKFPNADVYVIARKNDSFNGLREQGKVFIYDPSEPSTALQALETVHRIFIKRSKYPEHEREQFKTKPVRLILADWYSIHNDLSQCHQKLWNTQVKTKLADIVTVAREFNCSLFADTQTFNLASLGIAEDSNIRNNLNIVSQGLVSIDEDGLEQGGFSVLQSIIKNQYVMPDEETRRAFIATCKRLITTSKEQHIPVVFSTAGTIKMGLLPNLIKYKGVDIFNSNQTVEVQQPPTMDMETLKRIWDLEFNLERPQTKPTSEVNEVSGEVEEVHEEKAYSDCEVLPPDERSKAITRILELLKGVVCGEVSEVIALITINPEQAIWKGLRVLRLGVTAASRDVFGCGTGGKAFLEKAKPWYEALEKRFGKIKE